MFIAFFEAFLMGLLPVKVKRCRNSLTVLGIANAFAGGVFIAIALLHIMPEQVESWRQLQCMKEDEDSGEMVVAADCEPYPLPFLLIVAGYTIILILDKVIFDTHSLFHDDGHEHDGKDILRKSITRASLVVQEQMAHVAKYSPIDENARKSLRSS